MLKRLATLAIVTAISASLFANTVVYAADDKYVEIYVATDGLDSNPGTKEKPLKTPEAAQKKVRELKKAGALGKKGTIVYFRKGTYPFMEGLHFGKEDSGTAEAPITYRSYMNEKVKFIGGVNIKASSFQKVLDTSVLNRLVEKDAAGSLYRMDLKNLGVKEVPMPYLIGAYSYWQVKGIVQEKSVILGDLVAELGYKSTDPRSPELFVDGEIMTVARYPNEGEDYLKVENVLEAGPFMRNWNDDMMEHQDWVPPENRVPTPFSFTNEKIRGRLEKWQTANQALMWGRWYWDWATQSVPLDHVEPAASAVYSAVPSAFSVKEGQPWYIYNLLEEIDAPGEYFLDRDTGYLYLYPKKDIKRTKEIVLTLSDESIINIDGASYINFKDIDAGQSRRGIYRVSNSDNIHILNSDISYTAERAIRFTNCTNSTVKNCYIHDVDGAISFDNCGDMEKLIPGNCGIENSEMARFARLTGTNVRAADINGGCGNYIRNNEVHDHVHMGIGATGPYHEISFNDLHDLCKEADDTGVIYTGRQLATTWGTVIKNNYIHDCESSANFVGGNVGIYLDDFMSGLIVTGNIIEGIHTGYMFSGYNNEFTNNILINTEYQAVRTAFDANIWNNGMTSQLIPEFNASYRETDAWKKAFPALYALTEEQLLTDPVSKNSVVANNYMWNCGPLNLTPNWKLEGTNIVENNFSSSIDPGFVDAKNKDYNLKPDADIYKKIPGFEEIPFSKIGRYSEKAVERVKNAIVLAIDSPYVFVNGRKQLINKDETNQKPIIVNNSTYVPFRFLGEALGTEVTFDDATRIATFKNSAYTLTFSIDEKNKVIKNGTQITLQVPLLVIGGRTYMPLRSVSEMIDKEVFWDDRGFITVSNTKDIFAEEDDYFMEHLYEELNVR